MPDSYPIESDFVQRITQLIEENLPNEQFGVSELAHEIGMSRSNLLRKIKKLTKLSASQFIRQVRLQNAMEMLQQHSFTVSEVSFKVGFNSPSYFIKCFHDHYGYPPGEVGKREQSKDDVQVDHPSHTHQLAAIMFTDIQGFTSLMQRDEKKAVEFRNRHREVFNEITNKFKGKILQYFGDGTLSTFSSAIDAVRCGIELQLAFRLDPQIPVRIGIHIGDIIFTEDDIIGDGVNIASRIESLATNGSVFISEKVYDEIRNQQGIQTASMGVFELKNVDKPMEVYAITNPGLAVPEKSQIGGKLKEGSSGTVSGLRKKGIGFWIKWTVVSIAIVIAAYLLFTSDILERPSSYHERIVSKKSIAVLPFINDSDDSTNIHIINGLMESILSNLQNIEDLRVISRTSVEKYRNTTKLISEIADELGVHYVIEGSGQKIGDQILLHIQLIEAPNDKHLLSEQYNRQTEDIFALQLDIAKDITDKIEVVITPEEKARIEKMPTENLLAYDYFLKGLDLLYKGSPEAVKEAISYFEKAIVEDGEFARAYADLAISYYVLDLYQADKKYSKLIDDYADKALLYDNHLPQSLIAKAFFFIHSEEYGLALPYLEKALEYNPDSSLVINTLADFYAHQMPNTEKYLEYAIKGINLDIAAQDSAEASITMLHVSNAFIQSGFIEEAMYYIIRSLEYDPSNLYSVYVRDYIQYAKSGDLELLNQQLIKAHKRDTARLDIVQEIGKTYYYMRDFESSFKYYKPFVDIRNMYNLDIFKGEDAKIGLVYSEMGSKKESDALFNVFKEYADHDRSVYKHLSLAVYHSFMGNENQAIEHLKQFSKQENFHYWIILFLDIDPLMDNIREHPEYNSIIKKIENNFWDYHEEIRATLIEKRVID